MTTRYLQLSQQHATGVTLTDTTVRFVSLTQHAHAVVPGLYAELTLPERTVINGRIADKSRFVSFLKTLRKGHKIESVNLVLDSALVQTLSLSVADASPVHAKEAVEKAYGLPAKDIIYDYVAIGGNGKDIVLQVTAIPKAVSQEFVSAFKQAGITVLSIESAGHALVRDLIPAHTRGAALIVNIDTDVTSLVYAVNGRVSQTTLLQFGDAEFNKALGEQAEKLKQEQGLMAGQPAFNALVDDAAALVHYINTSYIAWKTAHPAVPHIDMVYVTGAGSVVRGLDEYMSTGLRLPVQIANVWVNCLSFDDVIPAMPQKVAARYAAAIGVVLFGPHMLNLVPGSHARALRRKHVARISGKIVLSFILGVAVGIAVARVIAIPAVHIKILEVLHKISARW